jgi:hypothetical protein
MDFEEGKVEVNKIDLGFYLIHVFLYGITLWIHKPNGCL